MKRISRYLQKFVWQAIGFVLLLIIGLDVLFSLVDELQDLENDYQALQALQYVIATIPKRIYEFIPYAVLLGATFALGRLANQQELVVMRASGLSVFAILGAVLKPVAILAVVGFLLGDWVVPAVQPHAETTRLIAKGDWAKISTRGHWHRDQNQFVHVNAIGAQNELYGVTLYKLNENNQLVSARQAKKATYQSGKWQLDSVVVTEISRQKTSVFLHDHESWETSLDPDLLKILLADPSNLPSFQLWQYQQFLTQQDLQSSAYTLAFWHKLFQPLAIMSLLLLAVTMVFGSVRSVTMGARVFFGVLIGLSFKYLQDLLAPASLVFGLSPIVSALLPIALVALLAFWKLKRV